MARFVFTALGSLGDLYPMIPIAQELQRRGHAVEFAVPPILHDELEVQGFKSHRLPAMTLPADAAKERALGKALQRAAAPHLETIIGLLDKITEGAAAILTTPHQVASAIVGATRRIPWITLTVFPGFIPSSRAVPEPHWLPALPTLPGRAVNRLTWKIYSFAVWQMNTYIGDSLAARGLRIDRDLFAPGAISPFLTLVLSSPLYTPRLPDWPATVKVTGYMPWDRPRHWTEPSELTHFLDAGDPPAVITASTARNSGLFFQLAKAAVEQVGIRAVFLTGQATKELLGGASSLVLPNGIGAWPYIPLSRLLPTAPFVVHHAGIGTTQAVLKFGLPCVGVPAGFDQFYNANRIRKLGIGRVVSGELKVDNGVMRFRELTTDRLVTEMKRVIEDRSYGERARAMQSGMADENGAGVACDEIEAVVRKRSTRSAAAAP
jgi:rhamnosyltransferase subunit B